MKNTNSKSTIIHLINNLEKSSGGAQKILWGIFDETKHNSSILSYTTYVDAYGEKNFSKLLWPFIFIKCLSKTHTVVIHHRMFLLLIPLFRLLQIRTIFLCHNIFPDKNAITSAFKAHHAIAISQASHEYLERLGYSEISIIENYIEYDNKHFKRTKLPGDNTVKVGYIGRLAHQKGLDLLIEACSSIANSNELELHIIGDGPLKQWAHDITNCSTLKGRVKFHGNSIAPFSIAVDFDILVVPSRWEGFGLVFYEAIAHEHFIIASDLPTFSLSEDPTEQVKYFSNGSADSLADVLQSAISNSWYKNYKMTNNHILQRFSKNEQIAKYMKLLNK